MTTRREQDEAAGRDSPAIIPPGLPTLAGPGTIVTVIALAGLADAAVQLFSCTWRRFWWGRRRCRA